MADEKKSTQLDKLVQLVKKQQEDQRRLLEQLTKSKGSLKKEEVPEEEVPEEEEAEEEVPEEEEAEEEVPKDYEEFKALLKEIIKLLKQIRDKK
jgi:uncharacterized membrane-anchored protein YhcB (DUF1043 family)